MGRLAVEVSDLGKRYQLEVGAGFTTLREHLSRKTRAQRSSAPAGEVWALRGVSFSMDQGDVLGVIGRNGAGKSTLLKILTRITEPTTGMARIRGRVGSLLEVGTGFHEELTGRENIFLNGAVLGMTRSEIRARFDEIVEFSGVRRFLDVPIKRYSSGMKLRLAFSVAAHLEPEVILVDEVLAVGDAEFQRRCLGKMSDLRGSGRTVIFVSHDFGAIAQLCPRALWLDGGRICADGTPAEVISRYQQSFGAPGPGGRFVAAGAGPVVLTSVAVIDATGNATGAVRRNEPFDVELTFETSEVMPGLDLSIYLVNSRGVRVIDEALSDDPRIAPRLNGAGRYRAALRLPPLLAAGEYAVCVWVGTSREDFFDDQVHRFEIRPLPDDPQSALSRPRILTGACAWRLEPEGPRQAEV
jgi:ABC-type polysaccharide/polyol phosphate transport system ATPase subunit